MRRLLLCLLLAWPAGAEVHLVAVGVDQYQDPGISPLRYASADVAALAEVFRAAGTPETNLTLLSTSQPGAESQPTKFNLLRALQRVRERATADDTLVFFFAGHGLQEGEVPYLLTVDSVREQLAVTALPVVAVRDVLAGLKARRVVFFIDACRNDPSAGRSDADARLDESFARGLRPSLRTGDQAPTVALLLACDVGERAWEHPDSGHGAFTHFLLEGLTGAAAADGGAVTLAGLAGYVCAEVPAWAERAGQVQNPRFDNPDGLELKLLSGPLGRVRLASEPSGARISLAGRDLGVTPAELLLPAGEQPLTLVLAGYDPLPYPVEIRPGELVEPPPAPMRGLPGRVVLASEPSGATVLVDGADSGEVTPCVLELPAGESILTLRHAGHEDLVKVITVEREGVTEVGTLTLTARLAPLTLRSDPAGAAIYVDGRDTGEVTPAELSLPVGARQVRLEHEGRGWQGEVTVGDEAPRERSLKLHQLAGAFVGRFQYAKIRLLDSWYLTLTLDAADPMTVTGVANTNGYQAGLLFIPYEKARSEWLLTGSIDPATGDVVGQIQWVSGSTPPEREVEPIRLRLVDRGLRANVWGQSYNCPPMPPKPATP